MSERSIEDLRGALVPQSSNNLPAVSAGMSVEADRAIAQVQGAMVMAKRFPRDEGRATTKILECCELVPVAEDSFYSFPRGGQVITGPSIDLLKICARYWGNIDFSVQELERQQGQSIAIAIAIDLETNARSSRTFVVPHFRDKNDEGGKASNQQLTSSRDIYELIANYGSRRLRSCLEDLIPPHIVGRAFQACQDTLAAAAKKEPLIDRLKVLVPAFKALGVTEGMLVKFLGGRAIADMMEQEYIKLRNIHRSIKSGAQRAEDFFEKPSVADTVGAARERAAAGQHQGKQQEAAAAQAAEQQPAGEKKPAEEAAPKDTKDTLLQAIAACATVEDVNKLQGRFKAAGLPAADLAAVKKAAGARAGAISQATVMREPGSDDEQGSDNGPE